MRDREEADLVLIMGTSLKVAPVADILRTSTGLTELIVEVIPPNVPQILINLTPILHFEMDIMLLGESDKVVRWLSDQLQWESADGLKEEEREDLVWRSGTDELHVPLPLSSVSSLSFGPPHGLTPSSHLHILASAKDGPGSVVTVQYEDESDGEGDEEEEEQGENAVTHLPGDDEEHDEFHSSPLANPVVREITDS